ncbi:hypothetical protein OQJ18_06440 [Fluoribacter dumoffii]|uniref:Coiled coil domain-containing protein n=1 Tax=Fluoribacter dumoffii TaxID=463 RepID=A0A377G9H5_9GAMM|nr:hypothetical protein [Fluoribacter dumoffii]KTC89920.1 coiled coil domain-containing protein [Fluoribacter dumoffii NY 23]MCW8418272.1 hypothetical protein [Fluoribacter dumoffii]MCW8453886.1 hypothetical protein [Fluoribacter dumoffii]MCW8462043.1 hypothetical protein [Fluoribacter dumoffii]MCW8482255.1 hypothetical protein [Fluoribacter dumoffii]
MPSFRKAFFNIFNSQQRVRQFSPEEQEKIYQEYRNSVGLTQDINFGSKAFDTHVQHRIKDHTGFKTAIGPEKEDTLEKLLKGDTPPAKQEIRDELKNLLTPKDFFTHAQETYNESMEVFQKRIKEVPELSIESMRGFHEQITTQARNALEAQQKVEMEALKTNAKDLAAKIGTLSGTTDPEQLKKIEDNLIGDLKKSHEDQLSEFNKTASENLTAIDKASALERKRIIFSGQLENWASQLSKKQKDEMLLEMERARAENRKKRGIAEDEFVSASVDVRDHTISTINPNDLNFIISLSGSKIQHKQAAKEGEPGLWSVSMPPRILSPFYYLSNKQNPKVDMLTMAQAVRASGFDSITMTINFDDPKTKKDRARQAYEAALECGFEPGPLPGQKGDKPLKGIVLRDGAGNEIDPATIFTPGELRELHASASERRDKLKKLVDEPPRQQFTKEATERFRKEIDDGRNDLRAKAGKAAIDEEKEKEYHEEIKTTLGQT